MSFLIYQTARVPGILAGGLSKASLHTDSVALRSAGSRSLTQKEQTPFINNVEDGIAKMPSIFEKLVLENKASGSRRKLLYMDKRMTDSFPLHHHLRRKSITYLSST